MTAVQQYDMTYASFTSFTKFQPIVMISALRSNKTPEPVYILFSCYSINHLAFRE